MTWTLAATLETVQDWQFTPAIPSELGYIRLTFPSAGIPIQLAQYNLETGDFLEIREIVSTPYAQIFRFQSPAVFGENRALAIRWTAPIAPFAVEIETSDLPIGSGVGGNADLSPILNAIVQVEANFGGIFDAFDNNYFQPSVEREVGIIQTLNQILQTLNDTGSTDLAPILTEIENLSDLVGNLDDAKQLEIDIIKALLNAIKDKTDVLSNPDLSGLVAPILTEIENLSDLVGNLDDAKQLEIDIIKALLNAIKDKTDVLSNPDLSELTTKSAEIKAQTESNSTKLDQVLQYATAQQPLILVTQPYVILSRSSILEGTAEPTYASLTDRAPNTGWISAAGASETLTIDLGIEMRIRGFSVGGGSLGSVSNVANVLNGASIQYSLNNQNWLTFLSISAVENSQSSGNQYPIFARPGVIARYWRQTRAGQTGTTELRFFS